MIGATHAINAKEEDPVKRIREITGGGADYAFDAIGSARTVQQAFECVRIGGTAIEVGDSAAGLRVLQSDVRIDLLITDVGLPGGMNGRQMSDAARVTRPDLRVLFITGYAENAVVGNGHLAPGMEVLTKPFAIDTMAARIRSMIEAVREARRQGPS